MYQYGNLILTGKHLILTDSFDKNYKSAGMIEGKYCTLVHNDKRFKKIKNNEIYTIYHLVLKGHKSRYGIYINDGILSETTPREKFINQFFKTSE